MSGQQDVQVKTYKTPKEFNDDAAKMARDRWVYDASQIRRAGGETKIVTYDRPEQYTNDAQKWTAGGWEIASTTMHQPRSGCMRNILLLGLFRPHRAQTVVTYSRAEMTVTYTRPKL